MKLARNYFFLFCVLFAVNLNCQTELPPKLKFNSLKVEDGMPNNIVNDIVQDAFGFIWIATNDGLCRYDGENFKIFRESLDQKNSISNNFIQSLFLDSKGDLWIMTDQGLNRYDMDKEYFEIFLADDKGVLSHNSVTKMVERKDGSYLIGSYGGGIDILKQGKFVKNYSSLNSSPISSDLISSLQIQNDSMVWAGTWNMGLNLINLNTDKSTSFNFGKNKMTPSAKINSLYLDADEFLWIGTDKGFTVYNTIEKEFFTITQENSSHFSDNDILNIFEDNDGVMWFGTRNSGILKADKKDILSEKEDTHYTSFKPTGKDESVNYRSISSFMQDNENNIWIGTHLAGVNIVNPKGEAIRYYSKFSDFDNLNNQSIWGICEDKKGNIWLGTDGGGLIKFNPTTQDIKLFENDENDDSSISDNAILTACFDSQNNLWLGTYAGGLNKLAPNTSKFKHYKEGLQPKSINGNDVRIVFEDSKKRIWIGTNGGGLQQYNEQTDDFDFAQDIGWLDVRCIAEDPSGTLWIGTFGSGIISYNPETKKATQHPEFEKYNSHIIFSLNCTSEKDLWVGTRYKGLLHYDIKSKKIIQYTEKNGLSNSTIQAIVSETKDDLWISTNDGLNYFDVKNEKFISYKSTSGIQPGPFNNMSGFKSVNSYLVFGGINGLNIFYPKDIKEVHIPIDVQITDLKLFNNSVKVSSSQEKTPLLKSITASRSIELEHDQNDISIDYIAMHYPSTKDVKYTYVLKNFDKNWNDVGNTTTATYRNLSPGEYIFKVKTLDNSGKIKTNSTDLKIIINSPFWLTKTAILAYFLLAGLLIYLIIRYYTDQVKLRNSLFYEKKLRQQETALNQERFRFFTSFSHELRTPLTLILGPVNEIIRGEKNKEKKDKLNIVQRNAQVLLELINKMLEFRKTETEHNRLTLGEHAFNEFVQEIYQNFSFYADQKQIKFKCLTNNKINIWFDFKKMQVVINNVLANAFKFTPVHGTISLELEETADKILLHIKDSGVGIKKETQASIFNLYFHKDTEEIIEGTGIGLALCKKLMELHKGDISVQSELGKGSCFTIELAKNKAHYENLQNIEFVENTNFKIKKPFIKESHIVSAELPSQHIEKDDKVILIIDDNPDIITYVSSILSNYYKIITANNGKKGIEAALEFIPDLIISDIMMPEKTGIDLCNELKSKNHTSHIPIILLTAKMESEDQLEGLKIGADAYITKPFDSQFLLAKVENLFKNRKKLINHYHEKIMRNENHQAENKSIEEKFLEKIELLVLNKYDGREVSIPELALELGFSRSSLYRKVKAITGMSINHFIRKVRLNKAAKLILEEGVNVSEAAFEVGFNDLKYFRLCFKEQFGVVPSTYKAKI